MVYLPRRVGGPFEAVGQANFADRDRLSQRGGGRERAVELHDDGFRRYRNPERCLCSGLSGFRFEILVRRNVLVGVEPATPQWTEQQWLLSPKQARRKATPRLVRRKSGLAPLTRRTLRIQLV